MSRVKIRCRTALSRIIVCGEDHGKKTRCSFSKEDTLKLFSLLTLSELIDLCKADGLSKTESFLAERGIAFDSFTI